MRRPERRSTYNRNRDGNWFSMSEGWRRALIERGARAENGLASGFDPVRPPRTNQTALTALLSHGVIRASGQDAEAFLQGQLSNDIGLVSNSRAEPAAYCTPKGRVLATPLLWWNDGGYALGLPRELSEPVRRRLQMYVLRSKATLSDLSDQIAALGLAGSGAMDLAREALGVALSGPYQAASSGGLTAIALPGDRVQVMGEAALVVDLWDKLAGRCWVADEAVWTAHAITAGVPTITSATQDQFTLHMLNLDLTGAVSFSKGCYTGQEIVARTQYLGQVKRRLLRFATAGRAETAAGVCAEGQPVGTVVNAAPSASGGWELLAVVQVQAARGAGVRLTLGADGPPLTLLPLPYELSETPLRHAGEGG